MRSVVGAVIGLGLGVVGAWAAIPALDRECRSPDTRLLDQLCPPSALTLRDAQLRGEFAGRGAGPNPTRPAPAAPVASAGAGDPVALVQQRRAELAALQQRAASRAPQDPAREGELREIGRRISELRGLPYGGQAAADEALSTMSTVMPELANDPVMRAGLRLGGVALDAGQAVDHAIGPQIDRAAARLEGALSRLRPPRD